MKRALTLLIVVSFSAVAMADVFNMGGTRNADGSWTGLASLETVPVGDPGNPPTTDGFGAVNYVYAIGKFEVTAAQYTEFLNAVAVTDTYDLYNPKMADTNWYICNIQRNGSPGSYSYSVPAEYANRPVSWLSFWDTCRFANWLENGQPTGLQDVSTTEDGSYTLNGYTGTGGETIGRNPEARWVISSHDEWVKAAYYDPNKPDGTDYWTYPTGSDEAPIHILDPNGTNHANYENAVGAPYYCSEVGAFASSPSPSGTFDQGGNIGEWTDTAAGIYRVWKGGYWSTPRGNLSVHSMAYHRMAEDNIAIGFRIAEVPEPASLVLLALGGVAVVRRRR